MASPEKVFAEMTRIQNADSKTYRPMLPFISITRLITVPRDADYNFSDIRGLAYQYEGDVSKVVNTKYPAPVDITYQFDVCMKFKDHKNKIEQQLLLLINHPTYVKFNVDKYMNDKICYLDFEGLVDNSKLEVSGINNIEYRLTNTLKLNAWLYYGYTTAGTVADVSIEVHSANKNLLVPIKNPDTNPVEYANDEYELVKILTGG